MIAVQNEGIILEKTDLKFENKAVFNPACIQENDITHMFYRAINSYDISSIGYCQLVNNKVVNRFKKPVIFPEYDYEKKRRGRSKNYFFRRDLLRFLHRL